jgi:hypothetical protein
MCETTTDPRRAVLRPSLGLNSRSSRHMDRSAIKADACQQGSRGSRQQARADRAAGFGKPNYEAVAAAKKRRMGHAPARLRMRGDVASHEGTGGIDSSLRHNCKMLASGVPILLTVGDGRRLGGRPPFVDPQQSERARDAIRALLLRSCKLGKLLCEVN